VTTPVPSEFAEAILMVRLCIYRQNTGTISSAINDYNSTLQLGHRDAGLPSLLLKKAGFKMTLVKFIRFSSFDGMITGFKRTCPIAMRFTVSSFAHPSYGMST
jgi:hypothetical protein